MNSTFNDRNAQYTFVEHFNTGVFLIKKKGDMFTGWWLSAEGDKKYKVELKKVKMSRKQLETMEAALEQAFYEAHDC